MHMEPIAVEGLTTSQVARLIGVSSSRVIQLANTGRLPHQRTPLGRIFDTNGVTQYLSDRAAS